MENIEKFVDQLVKIEFIEQSDCFGHYPFQLFVETNDNKFEICALTLGGDVKSCYREFKKYINKNVKRIYMSLDYPAGSDIEHDFVAIFSYENGQVNVFAIPYELETGEKFDKITEGKRLVNILEQFNYYVFPENK